MYVYTYKVIIMNDNTWRKINKIIEEDNLTINDIYLLSSYLQRRYIDLTVKDNILKVIDNTGPYVQSIKKELDIKPKVKWFNLDT